MRVQKLKFLQQQMFSPFLKANIFSKTEGKKLQILLISRFRIQSYANETKC